MGVDESSVFRENPYPSAIATTRFYDAEQGRMMGRDPVKRGLNAYPYCGNDPVNYVNPTGEIPNIVAGGIAGFLIGGAFGFAGSAVSKLMSGEGSACGKRSEAPRMKR